LCAGRLQDAAHDVDRRVVSVEQRGRGDEAYLVRRLVGREPGLRGQVVHGASGGGRTDAGIIGHFRAVTMARRAWNRVNSAMPWPVRDATVRPESIVEIVQRSPPAS